MGGASHFPLGQFSLIELLTAHRSAFTLLYPFNLTVWICVMLCLLVMQLVLPRIAQLENLARGLNLTYWTSYAKASWYLFGTLLGESITRDINFRGEWAVRWGS